MLLNITEFIGHFHPVLVHLPIGILLLAVVLQWLSQKEKYAVIQPAVSIAYLLGFVGAVFSCITGLALANDGGYDEETLGLHKWMGITVAILSLAGYFVSKKQTTAVVKTMTCIAVFVLLSITGHLGGTLTHGEGYLTNAWNKSDDDSTVINKKIITNVQEANAYADVVAPILQTKCYSCHNATKQKGGLRLDGKDWMLKGGKEGEVLMAGKPEASQLYKCLLLDPLEEKHMPPKGKPQLTETEIMLVHWWIANGLSFEKPVKALAQNAKEKAALTALESSNKPEKKITPTIPLEPIEAAPMATINALQKAGVSVLPVAANSNYLSANFISIKKPDDKTIALLQGIKKQLVWLKLSNALLSDSSLRVIAACNNLTRLSIDKSNITDAGIATLKSLQQLQYINLAGTQVTAIGLQQLKSLPRLTSIFLYQSAVDKNGWANLQKQFSKAALDSGGYRVSTLVSDTTEVVQKL